ncbi:hypothetical protein [Kaarinaea lacus]
MRYLLILSVFLAGCASAPGINKSFLTGASDSTGKIIFSFTKTGRYGNILSGKLRLSCIPDVDGEIADGRSFVKYIDGGSPGIPISADLNITSQRPLGIVHLLELPEGDCKLFAYSGLAHGMASTTTEKKAKAPRSKSRRSAVNLKFELPRT